jgi:M6 family metalloprotease-like protein
MQRKFLALSLICIFWAVPAVSVQLVDKSDFINMSVNRLQLSSKVDVGKNLWPLKSSAVQYERLIGRTAPDSLHAIVLLCDFQDYKFYGWWDEMDQSIAPTHPGDWYFSSHDSLYFDHLLADVATYFDEVSGANFTLDYDICGTVANLPENMEWYGNHPEEGEQRFLLAQDAVEALDEFIDFSLYDTVFLIHAGAGEETDVNGDSPRQIYSSYLGENDFVEAFNDSTIAYPGIETNDDAIVDKVLVLPEYEFQDFEHPYGGAMGSLGVYCFEVGQRLGMLPLFDPTPGGRPDSAGIGNFGLMGYGLFLGGGLIPSHPCAYNKVLMGWLEPYSVYPDEVEELFTLFPAEHPRDNSCAKIEISSSEYFLLEYRLQDPDGNGIFSFEGDLNGNNIPDFYDASEPEGKPIFGYSVFNPIEDTIETLNGAEFDFFMSDNDGRPEGVKGAGSGVFVWHIDEWVINNTIMFGSSEYNGDPNRKAVDLEEADGIQDMDGMQGLYVLGGDYDSYRLEDNSAFTPESLPNTSTAGGIRTGIVIDDFSEVVIDTFFINESDTIDYIDYQQSMTFNCFLQQSNLPVELISDIRLPDGVDISGCHLLAIDMDGDNNSEIIVSSENSVYVYNADGTEFFSRSIDDIDGEKVILSGSPVAGDLDGDGYPEIILASNFGLFVVYRDSSYELKHEMDDCPLPPVLIDDDAIIFVEYLELAEEFQLKALAGDGSDYWPATILPDSVSAVPPVLWNDFIVVPIDSSEAGSSLFLYNGSESHTIELPAQVSGYQMYCDISRLYVPIIGGNLATIFADNLSEVVQWTNRAEVSSAIAPGLFFNSDNSFSATGKSGHYRTGWPSRPVESVTAPRPESSPSPLVFADLNGDEFALFTSSDGRLYLYNSYGNLVEGWPLAGIGTPSGTGVLANLDSDSNLELVVASTTSRISGSMDDSYIRNPVSRIAIYRISGTDDFHSRWSMSGGSPSRTGYNIGAEEPGSGVINQNSVICYPSPLTTGKLFVRAEAKGKCSLNAVLYNLEGEEVARSNVVNVFGAEPIEVELVVDHIASGLYVCKIIVDDGIDNEIIIRPVAVAR